MVREEEGKDSSAPDSCGVKLLSFDGVTNVKEYIEDVMLGVSLSRSARLVLLETEVTEGTECGRVVGRMRAGVR